MTTLPPVTGPSSRPDPPDPPDPMGFRVMRDRWRALPELPLPVPSPAQAETLSESLAADFDRFLHEPGAREFLEDEAARRLVSLVAWTTGRRSWTP